MRVSELYAPNGPFVGKEMLIVGLGASLQAFPLKWLETKTCVLLNDGHKHFPNLGPVAFSGWVNYLKETGPAIKYVVARSTEPELEGQLHFDDPSWYVFTQRRPVDGGKDPDVMLFKYPDVYWSGPNTISAFAVQFCVWCGASAIFLVGCDCGPIGKQHYYPGVKRKKESTAILASLQKRGQSIPDEKYIRDYFRYRHAMRLLKRRVWDQFRIPILTLSPFVGFGEETIQIKEFAKWQNS